MPITEQDKNNQLKVLQTSYNMYEATKKRTVKNMKSALKEDGTKMYDDETIKKEIELLETAQSELLEKYKLFGGDPNNLVKLNKKTTNKKVNPVNNEAYNDILNSANEVFEKREKEKKKSGTETIIEKNYLPSSNAFNQNAAYDVIPLPSNGECYKNKKAKLPVAYLTAYDENMIIAPNLYNDNKILDHILKAKVLDETIDCGDLIEGDREAIILFLRASGYGNEYPITAKDNETGTEFDTVVDLSKLKYKEFKLIGDENGWFDFTLPVSKKEIKFKFLTHNDLNYLSKIDETEDMKLMKNRLVDFVSDMNTYIEHDRVLEPQEKINIRKAINTIESWSENISEEDSLDFTHAVTNRLILQVQSVDGVTDKGIIKDFVYNMNVKDARALRTYIAENEPGIDYNITIEKPESLGGGSMTVFLQLDQLIFLNVA